MRVALAGARLNFFCQDAMCRGDSPEHRWSLQRLPDTPLVVTGLVAKNGIAGNWLWWNFVMSGMLTVFLYARLWRRAGVMTDIEFAEMRYSGKAAALLRGFRALYLGLPINCIIMGWFLGCILIYAFLFCIGYLIFGQPMKAIVFLLIGVVAGACILRNLRSESWQPSPDERPKHGM